MQTSINLQESFEYPILPLIIVTILIIIVSGLLIHTLRKKNEHKSTQVKEIPEKNIKDIRSYKRKIFK